MAWLPSVKTSDRADQFLQRCFEMVPGLLTWGTFLLLIILSLVHPVWVAIFVIGYNVHWLLRVIYFSVFTLIAYRRVRSERGTDWIERCQGVSGDLAGYRKRIVSQRGRLRERYLKLPSAAERLPAKNVLRSVDRHLQEVDEILRSKTRVWDWSTIYHLVILPTFTEDLSILRESLQALARSRYPKNKVFAVIAFEEREGSRAHEKAAALTQEFSDQFLILLTTFHPDGLTGESRVKGANLTWAAKEARGWIDRLGLPYDHVIVSSLDADTCVDPGYLGCLTYNYIIRPERVRRSYQPIPMYHNNIWDAPCFARIVANSTSFWHMVQSVRPDLMITFSSHAMSFETLVRVGYWPVDVVSDDSVIFFSGYFYYEGDYQVIPLYVYVSMDANLANNYVRTFINQYKQMRRWAWGIEKFPLLMRGFLRHRRTSFRGGKLVHLFRLLEGNYSWATSPFIIGLLGWLPLWIGGSEFHQTVLAYNLPVATRILMTLALSGLAVSAWICHALLPPRPPAVGQWRILTMILQWILVPFLYLILVGLPALDAQTRLMFGKYLAFWVTEKSRRGADPERFPVYPEGAAKGR